MPRRLICSKGPVFAIGEIDSRRDITCNSGLDKETQMPREIQRVERTAAAAAPARRRGVGRVAGLGRRQVAAREFRLRAVVAEALERRTLLSGLATLATFNGTNGSESAAALLLSGSTLFGTTSLGGANNKGEVFSLPAAGGIPTVLASFNGADGSGPEADLAIVGSTLFGTTVNGGAGNDGVVFSLPLAGGTPTVLASFNGADGQQPAAGLLISGSTLLGTTVGGGANGLGEVFSLPITGGTPNVLASFGGADGLGPQCDLLLSGSTLFGTTRGGGTSSDGVVFSLPLAGGTPTALASFNGGDGANPLDGLILSGNTLFGTAFAGGANDDGVVFSLPITGGTPTTLASFGGVDGQNPSCKLSLSGGTLFGTTSAGGANSDGVVFSLPVAGGTPTALASFSGAGGIGPDAGLTIDSSGELFGTALGGGDANSDGAVFELSSATNILPSASIGKLDPTFGVGGVASHDVGFTSTAGELVLTNGQTVIAGIIGSPGSEEFGLTRYNADGSLDTSFGTAGVASVSFQGTNDTPSSVALLSSGQILVAGSSTVAGGGSEFAIALFDANGALDTTFGNGTGKVLTSFAAGSTDIANAVVTGVGGEFFVVGSSTSSATGEDFAIAAYNANGTPATGFASSGRELVDLHGGNDSANAAVVQPNGELVVAGSTENPSTGVTSIALARLLSDGAPDSHFGTKGLIVTNLRGVDDEGTSVALAPKGLIVVGGESATGSFSAGTLATDFAVLRYAGTGKLDRTFSRSGFVITSVGQDAAVTKVLVQSDGKIVASGKTTSGFSNTSLGIAVARYNTNGTLDKTFNGTGKTLITLTGQSATVSLQRPSALAPSDSQATLRQEFEAFVNSAQGIVAATPGGDLAVAGNSGGFTEEGELIAAGIDLAAALIAKLPASFKAGASVSITIAVTEDGSSIVGGAVTIELFLSTSSSLGAGDTQVFDKPEALKLKSLQAKSFKLKVKIPSALAAGNYDFVAEVDTGSQRDLNSSNNIAFKGPFAVG
jgi:uncharacterized delta-60 repeat protein